jgi:hypothetical protein
VLTQLTPACCCCTFSQFYHRVLRLVVLLSVLLLCDCVMIRALLQLLPPASSTTQRACSCYTRSWHQDDCYGSYRKLMEHNLPRFYHQLVIQQLPRTAAVAVAVQSPECWPGTLLSNRRTAAYGGKIAPLPQPAHTATLLLLLRLLLLLCHSFTHALHPGTCIKTLQGAGSKQARASTLSAAT